MLVKCDGENSCGKEFKIDKFQLEKLDKGIEKTYFKCPHCHKEFIAFYTNQSIRKKQRKIRGLKEIKAMKKLKHEIAEDMKNLRGKIEAAT